MKIIHFKKNQQSLHKSITIKTLRNKPSKYKYIHLIYNELTYSLKLKIFTNDKKKQIQLKIKKAPDQIRGFVLITNL
ncbi:MAG: hypothetical protein EA341_08950 [Mongoliibacter sp.]|nr:MAG: hypothetical protein EA341_08950 [Mongoliibacter sp.]